MTSTYKAVILATLASCATPQFNYKWYGIDPEAGKILGATPDKDLPLSLCQGDAAQAGKCVVMFVDEFDRLRTDYVQMQVQLKECQGQ